MCYGYEEANSALNLLLEVYMDKLITAFIGLIVAVMVFCNGILTGYTSLYFSNALIHGIGLITITIIIIVGKYRFKNLKTVPLLLYTGGLVGVVTVLLTNFSFSYLGVSLTLALGQVGQFLTSVVVDHYGLFGLSKIPFNKKKIVGLVIIGLGLIIMMFE
jgi:transporter family-2 protein